MLSSFDFHQEPLRPLVLGPRTCPKSAYSTSTQLSGLVVRARVEHSLHSIVLRIGGNTLVMVLFGPGFRLRDSQGNRLSFQQITPGDRIVTTGTPDPQRALVYTASNLTDVSTSGRRNQTN